MPEENRVFDVSKPSKVSPPATSKPVIIGHHPMNDPMVRDEGSLGTETPAEPMKIQVTGGEGDSDGAVTVEQALSAHQAAEDSSQHSEEPAAQGSPAIFSDHVNDESPAPTVPDPVQPAESVGEGPFTEVEPSRSPTAQPVLPPPAPVQEPHIEGLHLGEPRPKGGRLKWVLGGVLVILVAAYLAIDSGLISTGLSMPFHIFKQKDQTPVSAPLAPSSNNKPAASGPTLPVGFKQYKLADTNLLFAAPAAWGDPTSTTDPGFSKRGGTNQPDGVYAYLVNFAANKDIQVAVTSSKFLPAVRTPLYYDYLQWCVGSSDGKIYQSILNFSTANKIDTPTTITCNQGPLTATTLNSSTIVQLKATDAAKKVIGDIYAMNLIDPTLVVFRVKDAAMTNSDDIKQLLNTVQLTSVSTPATSNSTNNSSNSSTSQ